MISHLSGRPRLFPRLFQLGYTSPFQSIFRQSSLYSSRHLTPKPWTSTPSPHGGMQAASWLGSAGRNDLCGEFFLFCLLSTCFCIPLWGSEGNPPSHSWGGFQVYGNVSSLMTFSLGHWSPPTKFFVSIFYLYYLFCLILTSLACLFRSLGSSASVQKVFCRSCSTYRYIFYVVVRTKVISLSYSSTIFNNSPHLQQFPSHLQQFP